MALPLRRASVLPASLVVATTLLAGSVHAVPGTDPDGAANKSNIAVELGTAPPHDLAEDAAQAFDQQRLDPSTAYADFGISHVPLITNGALAGLEVAESVDRSPDGRPIRVTIVTYVLGGDDVVRFRDDLVAAVQAMATDSTDPQVRTSHSSDDVMTTASATVSLGRQAGWTIIVATAHHPWSFAYIRRDALLEVFDPLDAPPALGPLVEQVGVAFSERGGVITAWEAQVGRSTTYFPFDDIPTQSSRRIFGLVPGIDPTALATSLCAGFGDVAVTFGRAVECRRGEASWLVTTAAAEGQLIVSYAFTSHPSDRFGRSGLT